MGLKGLPIVSPGVPPGSTSALVATESRRDVAPGRRVYLETYGCQMNVADSELMEGILRGAGFSPVAEPGDADIILLNTCAVREHAEERVFGRIGELTRFKHANPRLVLGITGCMAERLRERIPARAAVVDLVVGPDSYRRLPELIDRHADDPLLDVRLDRGENYLGLDPVRREDATGWVTIMRGCDRFCTFCIVPYVRGREKCVPVGEILRQVRALVADGYREVCLLGQTVNSYRHDGVAFADLLREVAAVDGIARVRFTSPHPAEFDGATVRAIAETSQVMPYVHLPVQSGADSMLARMHRDYTIGEYRRLVGDLRAAIPGLALSTDIIVGFSGETDEEFAETRRLVEEVRFDFAYMFKYSAREGTAAHRALSDDVPEETKSARLREIIDLQESISAERYAEKIGAEVEVLVVGPARKSPGHVFGRTADFRITVIPGDFPANGLLRARVTGANAHTLFAEPIR